MRTTKAYIASAGTAGLMLAASVCVLALVGSLVAFGSWPGSTSKTNVDQVVLRSVQHHTAASKVTVRRDAVLIARREARRLALAGATAPAATGGPRLSGGPVTAAPSPSSTDTVAQAPTSSSPPPSGGGGQVRQVQTNVRDTTRQVTSNVQTGATNVQKQVDQVVGQVVGGGQPDSGGTVNTVTNTVSGIVHH